MARAQALSDEVFGSVIIIKKTPILKPKTKEFACVREVLNFSRKDTKRRAFLFTFWACSKKVKNGHNQLLGIVETEMLYYIELLAIIIYLTESKAFISFLLTASHQGRPAEKK